MVCSSQELEAAQHKILDKRVGAVGTTTIPHNVMGKISAVQILDVSIGFIMSRIKHHLMNGRYIEGIFCEKISISNHNRKTILVYLTDPKSKSILRIARVASGMIGYLEDMEEFSGRMVKVYISELFYPYA